MPTSKQLPTFFSAISFPPDHYRSIIELACNGLEQFYSKGPIYLSSLITSRHHHRLWGRFVEITKLSRLPNDLYLIQPL
jgi:hypothetical protein